MIKQNFDSQAFMMRFNYNAMKRTLMKQIKNALFVFIFPLILISCGDNAVEPQIPDDELVQLAFSIKKFPPDFYHEDLSNGSIYYENTVSIKPLHERESIWIQLCTDDINTAREWSELSSKYSAYYRDLISERETEKYFEFRRVYSINSNDVILSRVHKRSYLDRSMYDFFKKEGVIGKFTKKNFTKNDVKELIEYIWFVEHYEIGGKVYQSIIDESGTEYIHNIYEIQIAHGDWGMKDMISLVKNTFYVNKTNGDITYRSKIVKQIEGNFD